MKAYITLAKPGITGLIAITTAVGYLSAAGSIIAPFYLLQLLLATALLSAGAAASNQILERKHDALMSRTRKRPLVNGSLDVRRAALFAATAACAGGLLALLTLPRASAVLLFASYFSYIAYTLLKRRTWACTLVGGIPGALPIMAGWCATGADITPTAIALLGIMYLWQMPHFLAIGWLCRRDYASAGFRVLSVTDTDGRASARVCLAYAAALIPISFVPFMTGSAGIGYLVAATATGAAFFWQAERFARLRSVPSARSLFFSSLAYIPLMFGALLIFRA